MAITVTKRGTVNFRSGGGGGSSFTLWFTPPQNFTAGIAFFAIAYDNFGGGGSDNVDDAITDTLGNTWTLRVKQINDPGSAGDGTILKVYSTPQNAGLLTTSTQIRFTSNSLAQSDAVSLYQINGNGVSFIGSGSTTATASTTASITSTSLTTGQVIFGCAALEWEPFTTVTADTDTAGGSWVSGQGIDASGNFGSATTSQTIWVQHKIVTAGGAQTFNLTNSSACDWAIAYVIFGEVGSNAYTIIADSRTFNETLNPANLFRGYRITADSRTFNEILYAANILASRRIIAERRNFALAGQAANFTSPQKRFTAEGRSLTLTGNAANLLDNKKIFSDSRSFVITSYDATLVKEGRKIIAEGRVFNETGRDASLIRSGYLQGEAYAATLTAYEAELWYDVYSELNAYGIEAEEGALSSSFTETVIYKQPGDPGILTPGNETNGQGEPILNLAYNLYADTRAISLRRIDANARLVKLGLLFADTGAPSGTWSGTAGTRYTLINDFNDTTGATALTHGNTAGAIDFSHNIFGSVPVGSTITSITLTYYARRNGGASSNIQATLGIRNASNQIVKYTGALRTPANAAPQLFQDTFAVNPATAAAWTVAQIAGNATLNGGTTGLLAGVVGFRSTDANPTVSIASLSVRIAYTMPLINSYRMPADGLPLTISQSTTNLKKVSKVISELGSFTLTRSPANVLRAGYVLAASGSFTLTRIAANLKRSAILLAAQRSLSLTGNTAGLARGLRLTAASGSFAGSYGSAGLIPDRKVLAASASLSYAGSAAALRATRSITAQSIPLALSAPQIAFLTAGKLQVNFGSFTISSPATGLKASLILRSASASYTSAGSAAGLVYVKKIISAAASFTLSASAANLRASRALTASGASIASSASATALKASRKALSDAGNFQTIGGSAILKVSRSLSAAPAALYWSGALVFTYQGHLLSASPGSFQAIGIAAQVKASRKILAALRSYQVTPSSAALVKISIYKIAAGSGAVALAGSAASIRAAFLVSTAQGSFLVSGSVSVLQKGVRITSALGSFTLNGSDATLTLKAGVLFRLWDGERWIWAKLKVWDGSSWRGELKRWTGEKWTNK